MIVHKGIFLTIDLEIAAVVAVAMSFLMLNILSAAPVVSYDKQQMASAGNDLLSVMQYGNVLKGYIGKTQNFVSSDLQNQLRMLPPNYCGNFSITVFDANDFLSSQNFQAADCAKHGDISKVKRIFSDFDRGKFGLAELEIWLR